MNYYRDLGLICLGLLLPTMLISWLFHQVGISYWPRQGLTLLSVTLLLNLWMVLAPHLRDILNRQKIRHSKLPRRLGGFFRKRKRKDLS